MKEQARKENVDSNEDTINAVGNSVDSEIIDEAKVSQSTQESQQKESHVHNTDKKSNSKEKQLEEEQSEHIPLPDTAQLSQDKEDDNASNNNIEESVQANNEAIIDSALIDVDSVAETGTTDSQEVEGITSLEKSESTSNENTIVNEPTTITADELSKPTGEVFQEQEFNETKSDSNQVKENPIKDPKENVETTNFEVESETAQQESKQEPETANPQAGAQNPNAEETNSTIEQNQSTGTTEKQYKGEPEKKKPARKRLTLQERLAQAAKGKSKKPIKSKSPSVEPSETPPPQSVVEAIPENEESVEKPIEKSTEKPIEKATSLDIKVKSPEPLEQPKLAPIVQFSTPDSFAKEREELLAKINKQESTIKELREEGELLSHKELKLNETIKKLRISNQQLEENLQDYLVKNDDSNLKLQELQDFLRFNKFRSLDQLKEKFGEISAQLSSTMEELTEANSYQQQYTDLLKTHEQEVASNKLVVKDLNDLKIQIDILKSQHSLELDSKENIIQDLKNELIHSKQSYTTEISRLEDKIENLRLEQESNFSISDNTETSDQGKIEEFVKLSESHHNLQKQYLSSQQNWKLIESNLLLKIDNLTNTIEQLKKQKNKLTQDLAKVNNLLITSDNEVRKLTQEVTTLEQQIQNHELNIKIKENDFTELQDKFDKLQQIYNQDRTKLNSKIESLNETIEKLKEQQKPTSDIQLNLDNTTTSRQISLGNISAASWNDIRFGESSTTPAMNRDFSGLYIDNSRNQSSSSFTEIGVEDGYENSLFNPISNIPTSSHNSNIQLVNKMSSTIRRLEIELNTLKDEYSKLSLDKERLEQELFESIKTNDELSQLNVQINELNRQIEEREKKEQTMLELIGEKSEQVEELKADVVDLKELCKLQVQQMIEIQMKNSV